MSVIEKVENEDVVGRGEDEARVRRNEKLVRERVCENHGKLVIA